MLNNHKIKLIFARHADNNVLLQTILLNSITNLSRFCSTLNGLAYSFIDVFKGLWSCDGDHRGHS
jgi:hypothetical protein